MTSIVPNVEVTTEEIATANRDALLQQCGDLARSSSVLHELEQDLKKHGFAGSTKIPKIVFLIAITRMFDRPVSVAIKGPSSSGKSFSLDAGLRYVPKTAYEKFQGLSDKALVYSTDLDLQHRILVLGEAAGLAEGSGRALLRQLLTENVIRYRSVQQTAKEGHSSKELVIKGPMALLITTTANKLHHEEETRLLSLHVDHSPEQIKRALLALDCQIDSEPSAEDLSRWHALHDYVCTGGLEVDIPYKGMLLDKIPHGQPRVLRDVPKVLALLRAHALLHQCNRERNDKGHVVAKVLDYYHVYHLIGEALAQGLHADVAPHIREIVSAVTTQCAKTKKPVSMTEIADILGRDVGTVSRNAKAAIQEEYLYDENPGRGKRSMLIPGERELPQGTVLPDPHDFVIALDAKPLAFKNGWDQAISAEHADIDEPFTQIGKLVGRSNPIDIEQMKTEEELVKLPS